MTTALTSLASPEKSARPALGGKPASRAAILPFAPPVLNGQSSKRIAILDPHPVECRLLEALSMVYGHEVQQSTDPEGFFAGLERAMPDLALIHLHFLSVARSLRTACRFSSMPVVLIDSASPRGTDILVDTVDAGGFPSLTFPIGPREIRQVIQCFAR